MIISKQFIILLLTFLAGCLGTSMYHKWESRTEALEYCKSILQKMADVQEE